MQDKKQKKFKKAVGEVIKDIRQEKTNLSINQLALEFDFDKSNLSKIERGMYGIQLITAWKISEALGIKFSDFAKMIEEKLGENFKLMDE